MKRYSGLAFGMAALVAVCGSPEPAHAQASPAASTLVPTGDPAAPYAYARESLRWSFRNDGGSWTAAEAGSVKATLDTLPMPYLRRVAAGGGGELRRQGRIVRQGPVQIDRVALAAFGYTALGDGAFTGGNPYGTLEQLLCHEFGHQVEKSFGTITYVTASDFARISWDRVFAGTGLGQWGKRNFNSFISAYSLENPWEDFADSCVFYWYEPDTLRARSPEKYAYLRDRVFDRAESSAAVWQSFRGTRNPQGTPTVASVSPGKAERLAWVTVEGDRFLSARDAAPARVSFGGKSAVSLAVSRTRIYAQVPWIDAGSQPVTVETPDGSSGRGAFEVARPWWQWW